MKKIVGMAVVILMLLVGSMAQAMDYESSISSGILASSSVVYAKPCKLTDLAVYTDGTNQVTAILYDNATAASGTVIGKVIVPGAALNGGLVIPIPVRAQNGIYISLSGTGGTAVVFYNY